jgi:hypothetical protein
MEWPSLAVIERRSDGVFLDRFDSTKKSVGDTWHVSIEDAKEQAQLEYDGLLSPWKPFPENVNDDQYVEQLIALQEQQNADSKRKSDGSDGKWLHDEIIKTARLEGQDDRARRFRGA